MNIQTITHPCPIAVVNAVDAPIACVQDALDLMMTVQYDTGAARIALSSDCLDAKFFILSSGLAGEILQKFINYQLKLAIFGDFTPYTHTSKPLRDFIYESNHGKDIFFACDQAEAVALLSRAQ